jgi:DNA repair protein RadC
MKIKDIPWYNRPGIRLKRKGVNTLSDAELLAVVLGRGNTKENAIDISNRVLKNNNFNKLSNLSFHELKTEFKDQVPAMKIQAMYEIFRRSNRLKDKGFKTKIKNAEDVYNYFKDELEIKNKEHFYALLLDTKNQIIGEELISVGTLNASLIHPREVFNPAIKSSANSIILIHNHPSGDCAPSMVDNEVTKMMSEAGKMIGIDVLDHVIIGRNGYFSIKEKSMLVK